MDASNFPKTDAAVMLLNEIEILLAQTRLMELYLKQAKAIADNETVRLHQHYQAELDALRAAAAEKEHVLAVDRSAGSEAEKILREHIGDLENRLNERQRLLEDRDTDLKPVQLDRANLQAQIVELENAQRRAQAIDQEAARVRQGLQAELVGLRHQLEKNQDDFQTQQSSSRRLQENLQAQITRLREQTEEKQAQSQLTSGELTLAKQEIAGLYACLNELRASSQETQQLAAEELGRTRAGFEAELRTLQTALASQDSDVLNRENAFAEIERSLKTEIVALRSQLEQKQELIEVRDEELRDTHAQMTALQQRMVELETSHDSLVANAAGIDALHGSLENEIAALRQELALKEKTLSQRQEAVTAAELALHGKIRTLQEELSYSRSAANQGKDAHEAARADAATSRRQPAEQEAVAASADSAARELEEERKRRLELDTELGRLHATLAQTEYALKDQEKFVRAAEARFDNEIGQLRDQLAQRDAEAETTGSEVARLRDE